MAEKAETERLLIVSSDGHVGAHVEDYRSYIDPEYRQDFEDWLAQYVPMWVATQEKDADLPETLSESYKLEWMRNEKVAEGAEGTWNSARRLESLDADGLAADVLFPDDQSANSPPFLWFAREFNRPWDKEYSPELKLAGARAYNRWLAEFCSAAPYRLLGLAMIGSMADVDGAVAEIRRAKDDGLNGGVLLPLIYYNSPEEPFWNDRRYDPIWETALMPGCAACVPLFARSYLWTVGSPRWVSPRQACWITNTVCCARCRDFPIGWMCLCRMHWWRAWGYPCSSPGPRTPPCWANGVLAWGVEYLTSSISP